MHEEDFVSEIMLKLDNRDIGLIEALILSIEYGRKNKPILLERPIYHPTMVCPDCSGQGFHWHWFLKETCATCKGTKHINHGNPKYKVY